MKTFDKSHKDGGIVGAVPLTSGFAWARGSIGKSRCVAIMAAVSVALLWPCAQSVAAAIAATVGQVGVDSRKYPKRPGTKNSPASTSRSRPSRSKPAPPKGTVVFNTDLACRITLGTYDVGRLEEQQHREVSIGIGQYLVTAKSLDNLYTWTKAIQVEESASLRVVIELKGKKEAAAAEVTKSGEPKKTGVAQESGLKRGEPATGVLKEEPKPISTFLSAGDHEKNGDRLMAETRWADAASEYRKAIAIKPDIILLHAKLASALVAQKNYAEAEVEYLEIASHEPTNPLWHFNLGLALAAQQKYEEAESELTSAVTLAPTNVQFRGTLQQVRQMIAGRTVTGWLKGTVKDQQERVVPGTYVRARNEATGLEASTQTNVAGVYSFANLVPGSYTLIFEKTGFKRLEFQFLTLSRGQPTTLDCSLTEGSGGVVVIDTRLPSR